MPLALNGLTHNLFGLNLRHLERKDRSFQCAQSQIICQIVATLAYSLIHDACLKWCGQLDHGIGTLKASVLLLGAAIPVEVRTHWDALAVHVRVEGCSLVHCLIAESLQVFRVFCGTAAVLWPIWLVCRTAWLVPTDRFNVKLVLEFMLQGLDAYLIFVRVTARLHQVFCCVESRL